MRAVKDDDYVKGKLSKYSFDSPFTGNFSQRQGVAFLDALVLSRSANPIQ